MNRIASFLSCSLLSASLLSAQTQTLRGKVEDVQGTANQFVLDGTNLPLVSTALNLNLWIGQQAILQVVNVGTPGAPLLRVDAAVATTKILDMGNLQLGQTDTWEVRASAGSVAFLFLDRTSSTGFLPLFGFGVWVLGVTPYQVAWGFTNGANVFQVPFTTPADPTLIGLPITSQALVGDPTNAWYFSNPDNKTVQP